MRNLRELVGLARNIKKSKMIDINFDCEKKFQTIRLQKFVKNCVSQVVGIIDKKKNFYVSIYLTNNDKIKEINSEYRKIDKVTNVLSFPQNEERMITKSKKQFILGDVVISLEKISMEAMEQKKSFWDHLLHMIIHSILHLFGYDHQNDKEALLMEKAEKQILVKFLKKENKSL